MKILAWILLVMGVLLILAAIIIFLKFGGREACENLSYIEYLADYLTFADEEEGFEVVKSMKETGYLEDLKYLSGSRDEEDAYAEEAA